MIQVVLAGGEPDAGPDVLAGCAGPALRGLSRFAVRRGVPAGGEFLLDYDVIEAFCVAGLPRARPSTRGTYRSALYRLAAPVHGEPGRRGTPFAGAKPPPAYSPAERAELAAIAAAQRDPARRRSALAMVVFGIGAGLRPGELVALRGTDVARRGRRVSVRVSGSRQRLVPVASRYAGRAAELAYCAGGGFVFRPGRADRGYKNFVTNFARTLAADPAAPRLALGRCRSSFVCGHLAAGTPVGELLAITGICQAESLARYACHVQGAPSKAVLRAWDKRQH
jgi:integrase